MPAIVRMVDLGLDTMWRDKPRIERWLNDPRPPGVRADLLFRLAAHRKISASEEASARPR